MVQTKLEGYGALPRRKGAGVGEAYVASQRASARYAGSWKQDPELVRRVSVGLQNAILAHRQRWAEDLGERLQGILRLLRGRQGEAWCSDLYGLYVQLCAEQGWPVVGARRFSQYLDRLEEQDRIRTTTRSYGRYGVRRLVTSAPAGRVSSEGVDTSEGPARTVGGWGGQDVSYDTLCRMTHRLDTEG